MNRKIHIGTSGWNYRHWRGVVYPQDIPAKDWLRHYAESFEDVEINTTFYNLPEEKAFNEWKKGTPDGFLFAVKASRYITHMKKLKDCRQPLEKFLQRVETLGNKLGPVLFQLPPKWKYNEERLVSFLEILPEHFRYVFEFRDQSWWNDQVYAALRERDAAFCAFELAGWVSPVELTASFGYVRLHGPDGAYEGRYGNEALSAWADTFKSWRRRRKEIFCFFDNDQHGYAVEDAKTMRSII
jgi:uncharacterized protein YecE (DUF72 family)